MWRLIGLGSRFIAQQYLMVWGFCTNQFSVAAMISRRNLRISFYENLVQLSIFIIHVNKSSTRSFNCVKLCQIVV